MGKKQVSQLTGFLFHVSFVVRPGKFFVNRLLTDVGMPQSAAASGVAPIGLGQRAVLGPESHFSDASKQAVGEGLFGNGCVLAL